MQKSWHINVLELEVSKASNSFIQKIQKTKFDSSTDRQHGSSFLCTKHRRHQEQTFNENLEINLEFSHREENTFGSRIYSESQNQTVVGNPETSRTATNGNFV